MAEIKPSDLTLTSNYVALEPGNYPARTDLTKHKGTNLTEAEALDFKLNIPLGVGNSNSVIYIYQQGTIEIIGEVYCWNKLVKPGIYSRYEKLRYLTEEVISDRDKDDVYKHHASYNKTIRVPNSFINKRNNTNNNGWQLRYNYVSFDHQIVKANGGKSYPIPIFNGKLTIYPDGTFKTENIVIKSDDTKIVDPYGYIADSKNYGSITTYYDDVTKDDVNPRNVYRLISENEDGSVTYGAIEANQDLTPTSFPKLPLGIIPINDSKVTVNTNGTIDISGTVITSTGYKINGDHFRYIDLVSKVDGVLKFNEDMLDKSGVYNPTFTYISSTGLEYNKIISIANGVNDVYRYHTENDTYNSVKTLNGLSTTFTPMKGWNTFVKGTDGIPFGLIWNYIVATDNNNRPVAIDKTHYPWVVKGIFNINDRFIYPHLRYSPDEIIDVYATVDHTLFWNPDNLLSYQFINSSVDVPNKASETKLYQTFPTLTGVDKIELPEGYNFIPYTTSNDSNVPESKIIITEENGQKYITVTGKVIWKRKEEYFTLNPGKVKLDYTWPSIVEDEQGHFKKLFNVNGYFNSKVVFKDPNDPNSVYTIDGIRTRTDGLFSLIKRNITHYLTDYEKMIIDNTGKHFKDYITDKGYKIIEKSFFYLNTEFTNKHTDIVLNYFSLRYHNYLPWFFESSKLFVENRNNTDINQVHRFFYQDRGKNELTFYRDAIFNLKSLTRSETDWYILKAVRGVYIKDNLEGLKLIKTRDPQYNASTIAGHAYFGNFSYSNKHGVGKYRANDGGVLFKNTFAFNHTDNKHVLTDGPVQITLTRGMREEVTVFYRTSEDTLDFPRHVTRKQGEGDLISLNITLDNRYGWIDVWVDDPYGEEHDLTIKRLRLRKDRTNASIQLTYPPKTEISTRTPAIIGKGEQGATFVLYKHGKENNVLYTGTVNENGVWKFTGLNTLEVNQIYTIKQTDEFGGVTYESFTLLPYRFKNGDKITITDLMGNSQTHYVVPVNIQRGNNSDLNIVSRISFIDDGIYQYYKIEGIVADELGNIYPEGTYRMGTKPNGIYISEVFIKTNRLKETIGASKQIVDNGVKKYVYSTETAYNAVLEDVIRHVRVINATNTKQREKWLNIESWETSLRNHLNGMTQVEFNRQYPKISGIDKNAILRHFTERLGSVNGDGYIGRYQNKITIEVRDLFAYTIETPQGNVYLYQNSLSKTAVISDFNKTNSNYIYNGYTPIEFLSHLDKRRPWFMGEVNSTSGVNLVSTKYPNKRFYTTNKSYLSKQTIDNIGTGFQLSTDNGFSLNGKKILLPFCDDTRDNANSFASIYSIYNWDRIYDYTEVANNDISVVRYLVNFEYTLTRNYPDRKEMSKVVFDNWVARGADPRMFTFDNHATGKVKYHENGVDVTIEGRVRVNGKYTRNKTQSLFPKNRVEFISFCPNAYMIHPDFPDSTITLKDDDSIVITGNVLYRNVDENCQFVDAVDNDKLEHRLVSVEVFAKDTYNYSLELEKLSPSQKAVNHNHIFKVTVDDLDAEYRDNVKFDLINYFSLYSPIESTIMEMPVDRKISHYIKSLDLSDTNVVFKQETLKPNRKYTVEYIFAIDLKEDLVITEGDILVNEEKQVTELVKDYYMANEADFLPANGLFIFTVRLDIPTSKNAHYASNHQYTESLSLLVKYIPTVVGRSNLTLVPSNLTV
nr:MAG TPA: hypothetical protein [Caudoviricetes sp.]